MPPELTDYQWLVSEDAQSWLAEAADSSLSTVQLAGRMRKRLSPDRVHLVLEQAELRHRAQAKFADAERMFFTPLGLEQSTDRFVAAYKADRFPAQAVVADLCCGIGGDLLAIARRTDAVAVERDPISALLAEANARVCQEASGGLGRVEVRVEDVEQFSVADLAAWHIDPDRRPDGRRTTRIELHQPGVSVLRRLLHENPNAAIKLAPAAETDSQLLDEAELEWIGRDRQCRQLVAWFGSLAEHAGQRRATIVGSESDQRDPIRTLVGQPNARIVSSGRIDRYLFEPDATVLAAKLQGTLAEEHGLTAPNPAVAYLTGDEPVDDPALAAFEVTDILPLDIRRLKRLLHERNVGRLEIKKRGIKQSPEVIRKSLQLRGDQSAVMLVFPFQEKVTAVLARRV